jgi:hypothetical protein
VTALQITEISQLHSKQDMSRWTRAHADAPGINWSVYPGPGGTMIIVEHEEDRTAFLATEAARHAMTAATEVSEPVTAAPAGSFLDFALA